jgi:ferrochelatase
MNKIGVLLVNLGTPDSPDPIDVKRYLTEFLTDGRVIDIPWLQRQLLVRGMIIPKRFRTSAEGYQRIWTKEGSPLILYGKEVERKLQRKLGENYDVKLAMRYKNPSIKSVLETMRSVSSLIILPLFPQYASATTGSVHQQVMSVLKSWQRIPYLTFIDSYPTHPLMIDAFCHKARECHPENYDHILFSFHGLPERQIRKADLNGVCLKSENCCKKLCEKNRYCYAAQCHATAKAIAEKLNLDATRHSLCFQSRLGKDPWLKPYTSDMLEKLVHDGYRRLMVVCPAFVCDCLETIDEIQNEYGKEFLRLGGEELKLVPGLNDSDLWIDALKSLVTRQGEKF